VRAARLRVRREPPSNGARGPTVDGHPGGRVRPRGEEADLISRRALPTFRERMASGEPPWEWVEGDRRSAALFAAVSAVLLGLFPAVILVGVLSTLNAFGTWTGLVLPAWVEPLTFFPVLAALFFLILFPGRYPVVRRLGISGTGLRLDLPLRDMSVKWTQVRWVSPDGVKLETGAGVAHYRLTPVQASRIFRFFQPL